MRIREHQLVKAPSVEVCRQLAIAEPESRKVTSKLRVGFQGTEYDVSVVPGVMNGEKLMITRNPWQAMPPRRSLSTRTAMKSSTSFRGSRRTTSASTCAPP
ncbi:hypothetical protein P4114_06205 [Pseudomonas aeruginosa]|nr:hypothetical protein [Pseudomonas aeruginosa]